MRVRPLRSRSAYLVWMPVGGSAEELWKAIEVELNHERAAVLGRLGRRVETAISNCEALLESVDGGDDLSIDTYEASRRAALGAISDLCLQREIVGFSDQRWVHQVYRVPPSMRPGNTS